MKEVLQRHWLIWWWSVSAGSIFCFGCLVKLLVREPPFTDWAYIIGIAIAMPSALLPAFLYMLRRNR